MAAVTACSDFGALENKVCHYLPSFPNCLPWSDGAGCHDLSFFEHLNFEFMQASSHSSFTFIKRLFDSSSLSAITVVSSEYQRLLITLPEILCPACASSSLTVCMVYSAYKLNRQSDNIQTWCTPFPMLSQSFLPCQVITVASWPAHRFLMRQVSWCAIPVSLRILHSLLWSTWSKALV